MTTSSPRALITGASSGIGRATALALADAGYDLLLLARDTQKLDAVVAEVETRDRHASSLSLDLSQVEQIQPQLHAWIGTAGLDVLINNAGIGYTGSLAAMPLTDWRQVIDLNLSSVFECTRAALPYLRQSPQGIVVNVASVAAYNAFPNWGAYGVSKAALVALSKAFAVEERAHGVRVSVVSPGAVNTPIWDTETVDADFDKSKMLTAEMVAQAIAQVVTMPAASVIEELTVVSNAGTL